MTTLSFLLLDVNRMMMTSLLLPDLLYHPSPLVGYISPGKTSYVYLDTLAS